MKRPISLIHFVLLAGLTATLSGCASNGMTRSGFLGDYDVLGKTKYENVLLFKAPGFEPSRYREILVEDAQVVTATGRIGGLEAEQVRELLDHVNSELRHLQTKSEAPAVCRSKTSVASIVKAVDTRSSECRILSSGTSFRLTLTT